MRFVFWLPLVVLAGTAAAQWKHFGESAAAAPVPGSLEQEMLTWHNSTRKQVGISALKWSPELAKTAKEWADHLIENGQFVHSHSKYGENLFEIEGGAASAFDVVRAWAAEVKDYDYRTNTCHGMCGHYTQIVWGDTREVGCAMARAHGREVWVCEYDPPGNWEGRKPY
jgi:pathogenesis-related protein 1